MYFYMTRFLSKFYFRHIKQIAEITIYQLSNFRKLTFHFNASLALINLASTACKNMGMEY